MVTFDVKAALSRARWQAVIMLIVTLFGLVAFDDTIVFAILSINAVVWLVRFWYFTSQIHENTLVERGDR